MANSSGKLPYFIILSGCPYYQKIDPKKSPAFAELLQQEKERKLPKPINGMVQARATLHMSDEMLYTTTIDPETYTETKAFNEEVLICEADENGRILIEASKPELCRQILKELRVLYPEVVLDPLGLMLPEEMPEVTVKNPGGRGKTNARFLGGDPR